MPTTLEQILQDHKMPEVDLAIFGGKAYAIQPVEMPVNEALEKIVEFYKESLEDLKDKLSREAYAEAEAEWTKQIRHLERIRSNSQAVIPRELHGKPVIFFNQDVCEVRWVRYKPNRITGPQSSIISYVTEVHRSLANGSVAVRNKPSLKKVFDFIKDLPADTRIAITSSQALVDSWQIFCYSPKRKKIYTPNSINFHTLGGYELCTGNHSAEVFWDHPEFDALMNTINLFSLAHSDVRGVNGAPIHWTEFIKDDLVVSIVKEDAWKA